MGPELEKVILDFSLRMQLLKSVQENGELSDNDLTNRDETILSILDVRGPVSVMGIASLAPQISESTVSTNISKLWKKGLVDKKISPENQRVTLVSLTDKGAKVVEKIRQNRAKRFQMFFDAINASDEEKAVLLRLFKRGVEYMDKHLEGRE